MTRPHEDLQRHAPADHRPGGPPVTFAPATWSAIAVAHLRADRVNAGLSAYETLIEKARTSAAKVGTAVVLRSTNNRRVIAIAAIGGHDPFRHLQSAWDDHHLNSERHAVAESRVLAIYRVAASAGDIAFDPASSHAYAFEHVAHEPERVRALLASISPAEGFRGVLLFGSDDAKSSAIVYRFEHARQLDDFRTSAAAQQILGPIADTGDAMYAVHVIRTFG
jgi:hypothetical protein